MHKKPNILLIMPDQMRGDCLSIAGHPVLETPTMDSIGRQGTHFDAGYTTCALWRRRMVDILKHRPEGFSDGRRLIPGCEYPKVLPFLEKHGV